MVTQRAVAALGLVVAGCGAGSTVTTEPAEPTVVRIVVAAQAATPSTDATGLVPVPTAVD